MKDHYIGYREDLDWRRDGDEVGAYRVRVVSNAPFEELGLWEGVEEELRSEEGGAGDDGMEYAVHFAEADEVDEVEGCQDLLEELGRVD